MCLPYKFLKEFVQNYSGLVLILTGIYCTMKATKLQFTNAVFPENQTNNDLLITTLILISMLTSINGLIEFFLIICIRTKYISSKDRLKLLLKYNSKFSIILLIICMGLGIYNETQQDFKNYDSSYKCIYNKSQNQLNDSVINYQFKTNPIDTKVEEQRLMTYFSYLEMNYFCGGWTDENEQKQITKQKFSFNSSNISMNCLDAHLLYKNDKLDSTIIICVILIVFFIITLQLKCCLMFHKSNIRKIQMNQHLN